MNIQDNNHSGNTYHAKKDLGTVGNHENVVVYLEEGRDISEGDLIYVDDKFYPLLSDLPNLVKISQVLNSGKPAYINSTQ